MTSAFQSTFASDQKRSGLITMINPQARTIAEISIQKISMSSYFFSGACANICSNTFGSFGNKPDFATLGVISTQFG